MVDRSIRPAEPGDAAAVRDLVRAAYTGYVGRIGKKPAPKLEDYAALIRAGEVWVLAEGGEVLGMLMIRPAEDHMLLGDVAVAPGHQGRGLGRELVVFAEEEAAAYGLPEVRLYTNEKMQENLAVYARLGFEETGRGLDGGTGESSCANGFAEGACVEPTAGPLSAYSPECVEEAFSGLRTQGAGLLMKYGLSRSSGDEDTGGLRCQMVLRRPNEPRCSRCAPTTRPPPSTTR